MPSAYVVSCAGTMHIANMMQSRSGLNKQRSSRERGPRIHDERVPMLGVIGNSKCLAEGSVNRSEHRRLTSVYCLNIGLVEILNLRYEDDILLNMNQILFLALNLGTKKIMIC